MKLPFASSWAAVGLALVTHVAAQSSSISSTATSSSSSIASSASASASASATSDCISLNGSSMCPAFTESYVASFDRQFRRYFNDYAQFRQTQLHDGLQCNETGSRNATLQWSQTVLCGRFAAMSYNAGCASTRNQSTPLVCQSTCEDFSQSEMSFVTNSSYCTPTRDLRPRNLTQIRNDTIENDRASCTSWTSLYSADNATCISGVDNEANCGWGFGISDQLCSYCNSANGKSIASCCYDSKTTLAGCAALGYPAAAVIRPTSTSSGKNPTSSATSAGDKDNGDDDESGPNLSNGQLAGIIIGCVLGALLIGGLLAWLFLARKRRQRRGGPGAGSEAQSDDRAGMIAGAAAAPSTSPREKPYNLSEDTQRIPSQEKLHGSPGAAALGAGAGVVGGGLAAGGALAGSNNSRPMSTATSGTDGRGTTVPSVRCQYTGQDIAPGDDIVAIYPYSAGLSDELDLVPESHEALSVVRIYDDGWCLLRRPDGKEGAAPLVCCQSSKGELPAHMRMGGDSTGTGTGSGTTDDEATTNGGMTSGAEGGNVTSSVGGAVTADEYGFTSDAASR